MPPPGTRHHKCLKKAETGGHGPGLAERGLRGQEPWQALTHAPPAPPARSRGACRAPARPRGRNGKEIFGHAARLEHGRSIRLHNAPQHTQAPRARRAGPCVAARSARRIRPSRWGGGGLESTNHQTACLTKSHIIKTTHLLMFYSAARPSARRHSLARRGAPSARPPRAARLPAI